MKLSTVILLTFGAWAYGQEFPCEFPIRIESGVVCGVKKKASNGDDIVSFLGIPYAKAPIGELRFAEPQHPDPFQGVFDATKQGPVCPQGQSELGTNVAKEDMSEDCLRVNIHVPLSSLPDGSSDIPLLPVFAYIHGGSFATGSGNPDVFGPEYLLTKGVMLVTFNYRLNVIGFLSLNNKYIPGNTGLRDALFAMKWINRNVQNFGGDPDEVTISGQSAGGVIAHLLALSPAVQNQGLIKRVMAISGNAISNFFAISPLAAKVNAQLFLRGMNISVLQSSKSIHQKLIRATPEELLQGARYVQNTTGIPMTFTPVIESKFAEHTTIVPRDPEYLIMEGNGKEYPTIFSFTDNECQAYKSGLERANVERKFKTLPIITVPFNLLFSSNILTVPILVMKISTEYFNSSTPTLNKFLNLCTDGFYKYPAIRLAEKRLSTESSPTFLYEFGYEGRNSLIKNQLRSTWRGAGHSEDILYFFRASVGLGPLVIDELAQPDPDSRMRDWMTTFVANFVKTGNPGDPPQAWPPTDDQFSFLSIREPGQYNYMPAYPYLMDKKRFFDKLYSIGRVEIFG